MSFPVVLVFRLQVSRTADFNVHWVVASVFFVRVTCTLLLLQSARRYCANALSGLPLCMPLPPFCTTLIEKLDSYETLVLIFAPALRLAMYTSLVPRVPPECH